MATADKLITVAENVPKVYHAGQFNVIENTSTLKKNASGSAILIDDVSPVTHDMGVRVRGKNLFDISQVNSTTGLTNNGDGTLTVTGFAVSTTLLKTICPALKVGETYFLTFTTTGVQQIYLYGANIPWYPGKSLTITEAMLNSTTLFYCKRVDGVNTEAIISDIQIQLGTTATDYTSYVPDLTAVKVRKQGKNLISYPFIYSTLESNGITFTDNKDGTITLNGQNNGSEISNYNLFQSADKLSFLKPNTDYYLSCNLDNIIRSLRTVKSDGTYKYYSYGNVNFSSDETPDRLFIQIKTTDTTTFGNTIVKLQIELGDTATDYEQYITPTEYTPTADGVVNGVTSLYPNTTLTTDTEGVIIDCEYYKDIDVDDVIERTVTTYTNPKVKIIGAYTFYNCKSLTSVDFPVATSIGDAVFYGCSALIHADFPTATSIGAYTFYNCKSLTSLDFPVTTSIANNTFQACSALTALILRNSTICTLSNKNAFNGCTHITGTGGYIYAPSSLINTYKTATNWVTYASKFRALENYTVDGTTTGALDESKVST